MFTNRLFRLLMIAAFIVVTACKPQAASTPAATSAPVATSAQEEPVTLRLAIPDEDNVLYAPYVLEFVNQAKMLSNNNITIEPVWSAGDSTDAGYEIGVIQLVRNGKLDLGLAASRAFDNDQDHITSFQALQAPFLIDNDALAVAVTTSDTATKMLDNLSSSGLAGLTLWPEDLRHPFSLVPGKPLLSPQDFAGLNIRTTPSGVSNMMVEALGGKPMFEGSGYEGAESGLRQGASLTGTPTATGNVIFFAKYQVLFANGAAFGKLNVAQRSVLQKAAAAAQKKALAERPSDAEAGTAWCADGGSIVLASDEQVAAFQKAEQPVFDKLQLDSFNAKSIAAIRELKAKTQSSAGAQACVPTAAVPTQASTENQTWSEGLPPNGVWQVTLSNDDVIKMSVLKSKAPDWSGVYTFTFKDGVFHWNWEGTEGYAKGQTASNDGSYKVVEDFVRLTSGDIVDDLQWRLDEEGLHFHLLATQNDPFVEIKAMFEAKPWQKVEAWSTGLPPNGTWRVELSIDDFVRHGIRSSRAKEWDGTYVFVFEDGKGTQQTTGTWGKALCPFNAEVIQDFVRLTFVDQGLGNYVCGTEHDDIQWRLDADGLHLHLVYNNGEFRDVVAVTYEAKPWQKVAGQ